MSQYEQTFKPFLVCPETWNDPTRFDELVSTDPNNCDNCGECIGWESVPMGDSDGLIWHDYYALNEDLEIGLCPQCYGTGE